MKRIVSLGLLCILIVGILAGCGKNPSEVPDDLVRVLAEEFIAKEGIAGYKNYNLVITHDPAEESQLDKVTMVLTLNYPYGKKIVGGRQTFQYIGSDGGWDTWRTCEWGWLDDVIDAKSLEKTWKLSSYEDKYELTIDKIDFEKQTISCTYAFMTEYYSYGDYQNKMAFHTGSGTYDLRGTSLSIVEPEATYYIYFSVEKGVHIIADTGLFRNK